MRRPLGGFGLVALVIVVAIVLVLVARQWREVAPVASRVQDATTAPAAPGEGGLPDLDAMRERTGDHADAVADALAASE